MKRVLFASALAMVVSCVSQPYAFRQEPAYATLPRVNLHITTHQAVGYDVTLRDFRYALEAELADQKVAAVADRFDPALRQVRVELVDRGWVPGRDVFTGGDRLVELIVGLGDKPSQEIVAGHVHGIIGYDIVATAKTAELVASLVARGLSGAGSEVGDAIE